MRSHHSHSPSLTDDDAFSEDEMRMCSSSTSSHHQTSSGGGTTRKRRRGVIEKRRRDRINTSLNELKRLVPTALEKSGSAKLEKAEILQMTVDHLKVLQSRGLNDYSSTSDPHRLAADYHSAGFRECAAEVARYLVSVEGMDVQHPIRLRVMSHLQMFAQGRAAQAAAYQQQQQQQQQQHSHWTYTPPSCAYSAPAATPDQVAKTSLEASLDPLTGYFINNVPPAASSNPTSSTSPAPQTQLEQQQQQQQQPPISTSASSYHVMSPSNTNPYYSSPSNFSFGLSATPPSSISATPPTASSYSPTSNSNSANNNKQPYRPWGAEMAC